MYCIDRYREKKKLLRRCCVVCWGCSLELLYCFSVWLRAGMLCQYVVCLSVCLKYPHAIWVQQCRSAPATCQPKPPTFLQLLLHMPCTFLSLCLNQFTFSKVTGNFNWLLPEQKHSEDTFKFSYNIPISNNVFLLDWKWAGWVLLLACWRLLSVWSTPILSWQLQYKAIVYWLFKHTWVIAHSPFLGQQHLRRDV